MSGRWVWGERTVRVGPGRLMFGSDWPVCLLAADYGQVVDLARQLTAGLGDRQRSAVFDATAREVYDI
ncbi:amidohydrolase family protein [Saccharopolyspora spinosa]|uniref:amidohydrolase family protein n=1 Tax=Saccharopolyspora spinosa TaxID=60894 RepID=UPI0002EACBD2